MIYKAKRRTQTRGGAPGYIPGCIVFFILYRIEGVERGESTGSGADNRSI